MAPLPDTPTTSFGWVGVAGFCLSLILAAVKCAELYKARSDRSRDQNAKVSDAWFKTIVLDGAIPDLRIFVETQRKGLIQPPTRGAIRPYMGVLIRYLPASEELKLRLQPVEELSVNAYANLILAIENLDDKVAQFCPHADDASYPPYAVESERKDVERAFNACFRSCLAVLRRVHFELYRGANPDAVIPKPRSQ